MNYETDMRAIKDKVVIISGAASGLGKALCELYQAQGAKVMGIDVNQEGLNSLENCETMICDVRDEAACKKVVDETIALFGKLDILVNNAGVTDIRYFEASNLPIVRRVMEINYFGSVNLTAAALDDLKASKGQIIAVSSIAGFAPLIGRTAYAASKHAVEGFFKTLKTELKQHAIHVLLVCPGFIDTNLRNEFIKDKNQHTTGASASSEEVAKLVFEAARAEKRRLVTSRTGKLSWLLNRLFPSFYERKMVEKMKPPLDEQSV